MDLLTPMKRTALMKAVSFLIISQAFLGNKVKMCLRKIRWRGLGERRKESRRPEGSRRLDTAGGSP